MKNMKKLISALTALSFVSIAGISTVACGPSDTPKASEMPAKVLANLGIYNADGASLIEASINATDVTWQASKLDNISAANLLENGGKAKSPEAESFLKSVLKMNPGQDGKFNEEDAANIKLAPTSINPTLTKVATEGVADFAIKSGTVKVQWAKVDTKANKADKLGSEYTLQLKADASKGVVAAALPATSAIKTENFELKGKLANFQVGKKKDQVSLGEITDLFKKEGDAFTKLDKLVKLVNQGSLKITITKINADGEDFVENDSLDVQINFGDTQFAQVYKLVVPAAPTK